MSVEHLPEMRSLVESCLHSESRPREIQDVLDDLERMIKAWENVGNIRRVGRGRDIAYTNAGCTRDAARLIRVLYRDHEAMEVLRAKARTMDREGMPCLFDFGADLAFISGVSGKLSPSWHRDPADAILGKKESD